MGACLHRTRRAGAPVLPAHSSSRHPAAKRVRDPHPGAPALQPTLTRYRVLPLVRSKHGVRLSKKLLCLERLDPFKGRPRGTVGKASASEARGPGFEPPWLVQRSRWESRPLSLVGNGAGAGTHPIDREGSVFPRGNGRFLVKKGVHIASFRCLSEEITSLFSTRYQAREPVTVTGPDTLLAVR